MGTYSHKAATLFNGNNEEHKFHYIFAFGGIEIVSCKKWFRGDSETSAFSSQYRQIFFFLRIQN